MLFTSPIEMPRGSHYGSNYYCVYSSKLHRVCKFFSNLEYYNFLTLEVNPTVQTFCEQPLKIEIVQNDSLKHAVFDFWVKYTNGHEELQEVKYSNEISGTDEKSIRSQEQIRRELDWCQSNGISFVVRTEKEIIQGRYFISNLNIIAARLRRYIPTESAYYNPRIVDALRTNQYLTIEELSQQNLLPIGNELNHICYLYSVGLITIDIYDKHIDRKTRCYYACEE